MSPQAILSINSKQVKKSSLCLLVREIEHNTDDGSLGEKPTDFEKPNYDGPQVFDEEYLGEKEPVIDHDVKSVNEEPVDKELPVLDVRLKDEPWREIDITSQNKYYYFINNDNYFVGNSVKSPSVYRLKILNKTRTADIFEISELRTIPFKGGGNDTIWNSSYKVNDTRIDVNGITTQLG
ncbi:hypothetical protein OROGR_003527 [Orobanche gracilis]